MSWLGQPLPRSRPTPHFCRLTARQTIYRRECVLVLTRILLTRFVLTAQWPTQPARLSRFLKRT